MESSNDRYYESIEKALEGVGLKVDKMQKKGKKTVITILRNETDEMANSEEQRAEVKIRKS